MALVIRNCNLEADTQPRQQCNKETSQRVDAAILTRFAVQLQMCSPITSRNLRHSMTRKFDRVGSFDSLFNLSNLEFKFDQFDELIQL